MTTEEILARLPSMSALVCGDICLDRWCRYDPSLSEPSRETALPRVAVTSVDNTPGAAGTVAANLASLGVGRVAVLGVLGDDGHGFELERALAARSISTDLLIRSPLVSTFTYTKLQNPSGAEDLPRLDFINPHPLPESIERQMLDALQNRVQHFDVILVSDQAETAAGGVVTARLRDALAALAQRKLVWADSRARAEHFRNLILKINREEAGAACARIHGDETALRMLTRSKMLIVTDGPRGALLVSEHGVMNVPARRVDRAVDICGAGDSFSAGAALALAVTNSPVDAIRFGHLVASVTIQKPGTGAATPHELLAHD